MRRSLSVWNTLLKVKAGFLAGKKMMKPGLNDAFAEGAETRPIISLAQTGLLLLQASTT